MAMIFTRLEKVWAALIRNRFHQLFCLYRSQCAVTGHRQSSVDGGRALDDAGVHLSVRVRAPLGDGRRLQVDQLWSRLADAR